MDGNDICISASKAEMDDSGLLKEHLHPDISSGHIDDESTARQNPAFIQNEISKYYAFDKLPLHGYWRQ